MANIRSILLIKHPKGPKWMAAKEKKEQELLSRDLPIYAEKYMIINKNGGRSQSEPLIVTCHSKII